MVMRRRRLLTGSMGDKWMAEKLQSSLQNTALMLRESTRVGSWSLLLRLEAQDQGSETTTEEAGVEAWIGMNVTGTGKERGALVVAAGAAVTVLATAEVVAEIVMMMKEAMGADHLEVPLLQDEVGVHVEVLLPAREFHLAVHLCRGVPPQTGAVRKDVLFPLAVLCLLAKVHQMEDWTTLVALLLTSQMRSRCNAMLKTCGQDF